MDHSKVAKNKKKSIVFPSLFLSFILVLFYAGSQNRHPGNGIQHGATLLEAQKAHATKVTSWLWNESVEIQKSVKKGDTIIDLLTQEGINHQHAYDFFTAVKPVYDLRRISAGKNFLLTLSGDKTLIKGINYQIDQDYYLDVRLGKKMELGNYKAKLVAIPYDMRREYLSGVLAEGSLFAAILKAGEKPELADLMASLYEYDVDFNRDIRNNDSFSLVVEKMYLKGEFIRYGNILAAEFTNRGKAIKVIRFTDPEGKTAFYHADGRSVKKMFLRCPLPFMRVTSRYGNRMHPVLGYSAQHNGVDMSAPIGTPIKATASGIVCGMGFDGGRGRYIAIRHNNQYISNYYHLSGYQKGIKTGMRVDQSQIIGFVGSTGLSTGPHLHYGMQKSGKFLNPLSLNSPPQEPLKGKYFSQFKQYSAKLFFLLSGSRVVKIPQEITSGIIGAPKTLPKGLINYRL